MVLGKLAEGKDFLNLFAYTGAFTCAAAVAGAKSTVTVDRSATYLKWARDNLKLNLAPGANHSFIKSDVARFLIRARQEGRRFTLALVDPPSFFNDQGKGRSFDVNRDHPDLIRDVVGVMAPGATVLLSTNHHDGVAFLQYPTSCKETSTQEIQYFLS